MAKKFFIIAGEASGDILGAKLIKEIRAQIAGATFFGVGGKNMQKEGLISLFDMNDLAVMGIFEVVPHIPKLLNRINKTAAEIIKQNPDYVITIDSPDFNFRVAKKIQNLACKKIHFIAPSVWAYREKRAQKIAKLYDLLLTILPFEPPYFTKYGLKAVFVGHPIIENAPDFSLRSEKKIAFREMHGFYEEDKIIYITPGSRFSEVKKMFREFIYAINLLKNEVPNLSVIVATTDKTRELVAEMASDLEVKYVVIGQEQKESALFAADFALAKSGTNTLEASLYRLPMVVCYKINFFTHFLAKILIKIHFANLINLIMDRQIIPELLQENCCAEEIVKEMKNLIENQETAQKQIDESAAALNLMGLNAQEKATQKAAREILKL